MGSVQPQLSQTGHREAKRCPSTPTPRTSHSPRRPGSGPTMLPPSRVLLMLSSDTKVITRKPIPTSRMTQLCTTSFIDPRTSGPLMRQPSGHGTLLSLRPSPTSSPIWSTSLESLSLKCSTGQGGAEPTLSLPSCLMPETESSALVTTTAPSTPRYTAHTEQGLPVPARRLPITRPGISQKCPEFVFSANVSTKVSNFPRTSFLISLLMLSMGS